MTDIIKGAKNLLEGATPAPWKVYAWERHPDSDVYVAGHDLAPVTGDGWIKPADGALIAAAPEFAQALAEETWEYSLQILRGDEWEHASDRIPGVDEWFPSKYVADFIMDAAQKSGYVCRFVRRRVSPPEVINE